MTKNLPAVVDHKERDHAILAPSKSKQWGECPPSAYWAAKLPELEPGPDAAWGTEAHEHGEKALKLALADRSPSKVIDQIRDKEMASIVEGYVDFCMKLRRRIQGIVSAKGGSMQCFVEQRVKMQEHVWGTADFVILFTVEGKDYIIVVDLKTGAGVPVLVKDNPQLIIYAEGSAQGLAVTPEKVWTYIYQPRVWDKPQRACYSREEFQEHTEKIAISARAALRIVERDEQPDLREYSPGEHCRFCRIEGTCAARNGGIRKAGVDLLKAAFADATSLSVEQRIKILNVKSQAEDFLKAVEHSLLMDLTKGREVPGFKLVKSRAYRKWIDDEKLVEKSLRKTGIDPHRHDLITIGDAERQLKKKGKHHLMEKLTSTGEGKLQIVKEEDERPAVRGRAVELLREAAGILSNPKKEKKNGKRKTSRESERKADRTSAAKTKRATGKSRGSKNSGSRR